MRSGAPESNKACNFSIYILNVVVNRFAANLQAQVIRVVLSDISMDTMGFFVFNLILATLCLIVLNCVKY